MSPTDDAQLLRDFVAAEEAVLGGGKVQRLWASKHHLIRPLIAKAVTLLGEDEAATFHYHLMRVDGRVPKVPAKAWPLLVRAYERLVSQLDDPKVNGLRHVEGLYVFGFDASGVLPSGKADADAGLASIAFVTKVLSFTNLPGMRKKAATSLAPFAGQAPALLEALRYLNYRHDNRYDPAVVPYPYTDLLFWGMVSVVALDKATREVMAAELAAADLPEQEAHARIVAAVLAEVKPL